MVRFSSRFASSLDSKGAEGNLVMHVMLTACESRECAADLAFVSIARADAVADRCPVGAVVVRVVGPGSGFAQMRHGLLGEGKPVAGRLQFGGRQVQRLLAQISHGCTSGVCGSRSPGW